MNDLFTQTPSEAHFYLVSLLIELHGVSALRIMAASLDEAFLADQLARQRIASHLRTLSGVIDILAQVLLAQHLQL